MAIFTDIFEDITKQGRKIPTSDYREAGLHPIIDQGQGKIAGYTDEIKGLFTDVPVIIFGDHTRVLKYVDTPCFLGADGVKLLKARIPNPNYKYLYYALSSADIPNTGYNRHFKWLKEVDIPLLDADEQQKIVDVLDKISELIALRKEQLAKLDQLVKSRFIELFGDPVACKNKRKLSEIGKVFTGNTPSMKDPSYYESNDIPFIKPSDLNERGVTSIDGVEAYISEKARPVARIIPPDAVLVTCIGTIGKIGISARESCCNQQINFVIPNDGINSVYLAHCLTFFKSTLQNIANAPVVPIINKTQFSELEIPVFDTAKQNQFATFVEQTDKSKLAIQQSLDKLELLKKSLMQQYFG